MTTKIQSVAWTVVSLAYAVAAVCGSAWAIVTFKRFLHKKENRVEVKEAE